MERWWLRTRWHGSATTDVERAVVVVGLPLHVLCSCARTSVCPMEGEEHQPETVSRASSPYRVSLLPQEWLPPLSFL